MPHLTYSRLIRFLGIVLTVSLLAACAPDLPDSDQGRESGGDTTPTVAATTAAPETTPAPVETTAAPAPETTAPPVSLPPIEASGRFSSDTGSNLEIHIDWSVVSSTDTAVTLRAEAYITHYSIWVSARSNGTLKIGNSNQTFATEAITYDGKAKQTKILAQATVDVPLSADGTATVEISASWPFFGSYSGIKIDYLTCGGEVRIGNPPTPVTTAPADTAAPVTTDAPVTIAPTAPPADEPISVTELGSPILYRSHLFLDRRAAHFSRVTLVRSVTELNRLLGEHTDCTDAPCAEIETTLSAYDDTFFLDRALLLIPLGNRYSTASPVEIFDVRADDGAVYVHIRDIAPSRTTEQQDKTRFYLLAAEIPAEVADRTVCIVQHGVYYTDAGRFEMDYLRDKGAVVEPTVRAYQPAAIVP